MEQERAEVELTIQIGAETEEEVLAVLTHARNRARLMMLARPPTDEAVKEEQWCSAAMRVTVRRPHLRDETVEPPTSASSPTS